MLKALAIDLYRAQQRVHRLQEQLDRSAPAEREAIKRELRDAAAECAQLRRLVEAKKQPPPYWTSHRKKPGP